MNLNLIIVSGVLCFIVSFLMLYVLRVGFSEKPHLLKMFQFSFFVALFVLGCLQIFSYVFLYRGALIPNYFGLIYSGADLILAILGVVYYLYYIKHPTVRFKPS